MSLVLKIFILSALILPSAWAQKEDYLPKTLPSNYDDAEGREALRTWSLSSQPKFHNLNRMVIEPANWDDDQKWLKSYFELNIELNDSTIPLEQVIEAIKLTNKTYRSAGDQVRVRFESYAEIKRNGQLLEKIGVKREILPASFEPVIIQIHPVNSSFWLKHGTFSVYRGKIYGTSHMHLQRQSIHLADSQRLFELSHELNHALFNSADAYYKRKFKTTWQQSMRLSSFNIASQDFYIDPLEIYVGFKRYGHEVPGWTDYVDNQNCTLIDEAKMAYELSLLTDEQLVEMLKKTSVLDAQYNRISIEQSKRFYNRLFEEENRKKR